MNALIIVEGFNDCRAVQQAVRSPVYVIGGGNALADSMKAEFQQLRTLVTSGRLPRQLVVFMDPDWQGRTYRTMLDDALVPDPAAAPPAARGAPQSERRELAAPRAGGSQSGQGTAASSREGVVVRHAFLRVELGTSTEATRYHEAGSVGVEFSTPDTIRSCLKRARPAFGTARKEFSVEELRSDGLIGSWNDKTEVAGPQLRRGRFCQALGIDTVGTGKALLNMLNRYFTREEYTAALDAARQGEPAA